MRAAGMMFVLLYGRKGLFAPLIASGMLPPIVFAFPGAMHGTRLVDANGWQVVQLLCGCCHVLLGIPCHQLLLLLSPCCCHLPQQVCACTAVQCGAGLASC